MYIPMQTMQKYNDALYILHQCDRLDHFVSQTMEQLRNLIPYESGVYFPVNVSSSEFEAPYHVDLDNRLFHDYRDYYCQHDNY